MKIVLTGGHLAPALAVIEVLSKEDIIFIGRKHALEGDKAVSLEYRALNDRNIKFFPITTGRLQRRLTKHTIISLFKFPFGFVQSLFILNKFKPDVVLGFGGYVSLPVCLAAFFLKIPVVIHEQILAAGLSNRIIAFFAKKICISWETSRKYFPQEKIVLTGNPVRKFPISPAEAGSRKRRDNFQFPISNNRLPILYVTGGSLGSHTINLLVEKNLKQILEKFTVIHQTGDAKEFEDFNRLQKIRELLPEELQKRYILAKFIDPSSVGYVLGKADLVVSRCGINTITELIYFKKPSLLMPLLFSGGGEQIKNALFLKSFGACEVFFQNGKEDFFQILTKMFDNIDMYRKNVKKLESLATKDAAAKIIEIIKLACLKKQGKVSLP